MIRLLEMCPFTRHKTQYKFSSNHSKSSTVDHDFLLFFALGMFSVHISNEFGIEHVFFSFASTHISQSTLSFLKTNDGERFLMHLGLHK